MSLNETSSNCWLLHWFCLSELSCVTCKWWSWDNATIINCCIASCEVPERWSYDCRNSAMVTITYLPYQFACATSPHVHRLLRMYGACTLHQGGWAEPPSAAATGSPELEKTDWIPPLNGNKCGDWLHNYFFNTLVSWPNSCCFLGINMEAVSYCKPLLQATHY